MASLADYTQELFKKAGLDGDEQAKAIMEALGKNEKIQKAFKDGFVETSQYHSNLDKVKGEWEGKYNEAAGKVKQYDEWYHGTDGKPGALASVTRANEALARYQATYGPIQDGGDVRQAAQATGLSLDDVKNLLAQTMQTQNAAYVGLTKDVAWATMDYQGRFKEPLDLDASETYANKNNVPFRQAYKDVIAPKLEEQRNSEFEAKLKAAREEGAKDALSKHKLPVESGPRETHLVFDRTEPTTAMNENQQSQASRNAFLEGWNGFNEKAS